jgi:hypothetical protein
MGPPVGFKTYAERYLPLPNGPMREPGGHRGHVQAPNEEFLAQLILFLANRFHLASQVGAQEKSVSRLSNKENSFPRIFRNPTAIS